MSHSPPPRPSTPQVLIHRLPSLPPPSTFAPITTATQPEKYIIIILGSTLVAGKVHIAQSVARALSCPLYQGDSLHRSCDKAAGVGRGGGTSGGGGNQYMHHVDGDAGGLSSTSSSSSNTIEARYKRMWLNKLTRTGLLFPEESRPATEGFSGFGGSSTLMVGAAASSESSTSRRGSTSTSSMHGTSLSRSGSGSSRSASITSYDTVRTSMESLRITSTSDAPHTSSSSTSSLLTNSQPVRPRNQPFIAGHNSAFSLSDPEQQNRRDSPILMILTHPEVEQWHRGAITSAVGEYGIGVVFVPLYEMEEDGDSDDDGTGDGDREDDEESDDDDPPLLRPFDPSFLPGYSASLTTRPVAPHSQPHEEPAKPKRKPEKYSRTALRVRINLDADVEGQTKEIIEGVRDVLGIAE